MAKAAVKDATTAEGSGARASIGAKTRPAKDGNRTQEPRPSNGRAAREQREHDRALKALDDDDIRNVFALTSTLEQRGMKVVFAENGREGVERLQQHSNTDLVLLDIMMPEMDGYETARVWLDA